MLEVLFTKCPEIKDLLCGAAFKDVSCDVRLLDWGVFAEDLIGCVSDVCDVGGCWYEVETSPEYDRWVPEMGVEQ